VEFPPTSFGGLARCNGRAFFRIFTRHTLFMAAATTPPSSFGGLAQCHSCAFFRIFCLSFKSMDGEQATTPPSSFGGLAQCHRCAFFKIFGSAKPVIICYNIQ